MVHGELGVEPLERIEELSLVGVIERLAEIEVLQVAARARTGGEHQGQTESEMRVARASLYHSPSAIGALPEPVRSVSSTSFGFTSLLNGKAFRAAEVRAALELAVDEHFDLVLAGRDVADVDPLHAALAQGLELLEAVDVCATSWPSIWICTASRRIVSPLASATKIATCVPDGIEQLLLEPVQLGGDARGRRI